MGRWSECYGNSVPVNGKWTSKHIADVHNADCDAYEAKIAELEAQCIVERQQAAEHYKARLDAESRLARIAALVSPIPVADLVEAGTEAPRLLAERHAAIRAILEDEINE